MRDESSLSPTNRNRRQVQNFTRQQAQNVSAAMRQNNISAQRFYLGQTEEMTLEELRAEQRRIRTNRAAEIDRLQLILADQRDQLSEYERQKIRENLIKLQLEKELIINEFLENLDDILFSTLLKQHEDDFDQKDCVICINAFTNMDMVTKIPTCHHVFHKKCAQQWFKSKSQSTE